MERLQPRSEVRQTADFGKKIIKLMLYSFLAIMTLVGLWFAVLWTTPVTAQVDLSARGCILQEDGAEAKPVTVQIRGSYEHYRLSNEADSFTGELLLGDKTVPLTLSYPIGADYAKLELTGDIPAQLLWSRDQKSLLLEYALDENGEFTALNRGTLQLLVLPAEDEAAAQAELEKFVALFLENPDWEKGFHWDFG